MSDVTLLRSLNECGTSIVRLFRSGYKRRPCVVFHSSDRRPFHAATWPIAGSRAPFGLVVGWRCARAVGGAGDSAEFVARGSVQQAPPVQNNAPLSETVPPGAPADPREYLREQIMAPTTNDVPPAVDPWQELSAQGEGAFYRGCIGCHDADRSLLKSKSFSQWQAAIKRMAQKDGAELNPAEFDAIAAYLTRQNRRRVRRATGSVGPRQTGLQVLRHLFTHLARRKFQPRE